MSTDTTFVDLKNARVDEQRQVMSKIVDNNECPFCLTNLHKYHKQPILKDGQYWIVTPNQWPYENTKLHLMAIYKSHAETLSDLDPKAGEELLRFFAEIEREYKIPGGAVSMRFGDTLYSGGTVKHMHAMLIWSDVYKAGYEPVRVKVGRKPEPETKQN